MCDDSGVPYDEINYRFEDFSFNPVGFRHGSQGIVFPTNHKNFPGIRLAVKLFHTNQQSSLAAQRELELIKKAQGHKAIIRFYGYVFHDTIPNFRIGYIMDYISLSLEYVVMDNTSQYRYYLWNGIAWIYDLAGAVGYLHRKGFIHRDIKPSNILIKWYEVDKPLVLGDFGCGRDLKNGDLSTSSGSEHYCSPEQLNHSGRYGKATDVYSVGRVMWEVFHRERASFNRKEIVEGTFEHPIDDSLRFHFSRIMKKCLCFNPALRPRLEEIRLTMNTILNEIFQLLNYHKTQGMSCFIKTHLLYKDGGNFDPVTCKLIDEELLMLLKVNTTQNVFLKQLTPGIYCFHYSVSAPYVNRSLKRPLPFDKFGEPQSVIGFSWFEFVREMVELLKSRKMQIGWDKERKEAAKKKAWKGIGKRRQKKNFSGTKAKRGFFRHR